jgi:hypothetical protein
MSTATNKQKDSSHFLYFALCKLLFVHSVFYTNVKFCLQETIITLPKIWCKHFHSNLRNFKILKICSQNQLVKIDHIFDSSFENCMIYCNDTLRLFDY